MDGPRGFRPWSRLVRDGDIKNHNNEAVEATPIGSWKGRQRAGSRGAVRRKGKTGANGWGRRVARKKPNDDGGSA